MRLERYCSKLTTGTERFPRGAAVMARGSVIVLGVFFVATVCIALWGMNKGISFTDEGTDLLVYEFPSYYSCFFSHHKIMGAMLKSLGGNILTYRWARFLLFCVSSSLFAWGFISWWNARAGAVAFPLFSNATAFVFIVSSLAIGYSFSHQTASYNHMNDALMLASVGLLFECLSRCERNSPRGLSILLLVYVAGFLQGLDLFVKPPTGVGLMLLTLLSFGLMFWLARAGAALGFFALFSLGWLSSILLFFTCLTDFSTWYSNALTLRAVGAAEGHSTSHVFDSLGTVFRIVVSVIGDYLFVGVGALVSAWIYMRRSGDRTTGGASCDDERDSRRSGAFSLAILLALTLGFLWTSWGIIVRSRFWDVLIPYLGLIFVEGSALAGAIVALRKVSLDRPLPAAARLTPGLLLVLAMPFLGALGTNFHIPLVLHLHITPWFALLIALNHALFLRTKFAASACVLFLIPICFAGLWFARSYVSHPYEMTASLFKQTELVKDVERLRGVFVDAGTKEMVENLYRTVKTRTDHKRGDPIVALYGIPTLIYLLEGFSPGYPILQKPYFNDNCLFSSLVTMTPRMERPPVILAVDEVNVSVAACLEKAGIPFRDQYGLVAVLDWPYHVRYFAQDRLFVYAPMAGTDRGSERSQTKPGRGEK